MSVINSHTSHKQSDNTSIVYHAGPRPARGGRGGANTWGADWLGGPEIVIKHLVMGATVKRVGGP